MNFPLEYPVFRLLYWLINTAGVGGVIAIVFGIGSMLAYLLTLRWIQVAADPHELETYAYPTPALLGHEHEEE